MVGLYPTRALSEWIDEDRGPLMACGVTRPAHIEEMVAIPQSHARYAMLI